ncbi:Uncharacterised protein [Vibrio cholerae]|uniref:Uncharacterized protein n=1 Tax=Vibrio cholerae TaxID=666 RepID=A0A655YE61_VIBCL|nr:Uncharacterised protein [Vibrio cholerae]CSC36648.1 Uncharacterised protein [Vibrio cholerae]
MILFVDDGLLSARNHRNSTKCHFAVTAIIGAHQPFLARSVASDDRQLTRHINIAKRFFNHLIEVALHRFAPTRQIDKAGVNT